MCADDLRKFYLCKDTSVFYVLKDCCPRQSNFESKYIGIVNSITESSKNIDKTIMFFFIFKTIMSPKFFTIFNVRKDSKTFNIRMLHLNSM